MARTLSADARDLIGTPVTYSTNVTITIPGEEPVDIAHDKGWSVTDRGVVAGTRLSVSSLTLLPWSSIPVDMSLFELAGWPGATYDITVGINLGGTIEQIPVFHGYAVEGSSRREALGVSVSLTDPWAWVDGVEFTDPLATELLPRSEQIANIFTDVLDDTLVVNASATGGTICQPGVYTVSRGQAVSQLATDGLLQVGFNAVGELIIKAQPDINGNLTPDWHFRTDQDPELPFAVTTAAPATIVAGSLERTRPCAESRVNQVTVAPGADWQLWTKQVARLTDDSDPRHEDYVGGVRNKTVTSNTLGSAYDAYQLALTELTRRLRVTDERVKLSVVLNPAVEADDVISVAALPTLDDAGWNGTYIVTSVTHAPSAGMTSIEAVSASGYELGT